MSQCPSFTDPQDGIILHPASLGVSGLRWKCPECGLLNSVAFGLPCIACFWNISNEEKQLLEMLTSEDRHAKILPVLSVHADIDVCHLILEFCPRIQLLDCAAGFKEQIQDDWEESIEYDDFFPLYMSQEALEVAPWAWTTGNENMEKCIQSRSVIELYRPYGSCLCDLEASFTELVNIPDGTFGKLSSGESEGLNVYFHMKKCKVEGDYDFRESVPVLAICLPHEIVPFVWGDWFSQSERIKIARFQINLREREARSKKCLK